MPTDRKDRRNEAFSNFEKGARADEFIFGDTGYTEDDMQETSDRIASLETGTVPDPDSAFWNITILDNTLTANVFVSAYTGDAYTIVKDSSVTPTDDSSGATPPTGFTPGASPSTYDMVAWLSGTLRFYQWDQVNGIVEILDQNLVSGIVVSPVPLTTDLTTVTAVAGATPETEIVVSWVDPNIDGSGKFTINYSEIRDENEAIIWPDAISGGTVTGLIPGNLYSVKPITYYTDGKSATAVDSARIRTATLAAGTIRILDPKPLSTVTVSFDSNTDINATTENIAITAHAFITADRVVYDLNGGTSIGLVDRSTYFVVRIDDDNLKLSDTYDHAVAGTNLMDLNTTAGSETQSLAPATRYEQREDAHGTTTLDVQLERLTDSQGAVSVLVSSLDGIAVDTTNFTAIVKNGTADKVSWADADAAIKTVSITLVDDNGGSNKDFNFQIDAGSEVGGVAIDSTQYTLLYRGDSVMCYIGGSASGVAGYQQLNDGVDNLLVLNFEDSNMDYSTQFGDGSTPLSSTFGTVTSTDAGGTEYVIGDGSDWSATLADADAPTINAVCNMTNLGAGTLYVHAYMRTASGTASDDIHTTVEGVTTITTLQNMEVPTLSETGESSHHWVWTDDDGTTVRTVTNADIALGSQRISLVQQNQQTRIKKILFTTNSAYDPSSVGAPGSISPSENQGPADSTFTSTSDIQDDPLNATSAPSPSVTNLDPDILLPLDGATGVATTLSPYTATFTDAFNLVNPVIKMYRTSNDAEISGLTIVSGASANQAVFSPASLRLENTGYYLTLTADQISDSTGLVRGVEFGLNKTDWNFTTLSDSSLVINYDMEGIDVGPLTETVINSEFNVTSAQGSSTIFANTEIVDSGDSLRGKYIRATHQANTPFAAMRWFSQFSPNNTTQIPYPGEIYPNSTDSVWDLTGAEPIASQFEARQALRDAGTQIAFDTINFEYEFKRFSGADGTWQLPRHHKLPGLSTGTALQATHGGPAFEEFLYGFASRMQIYGPDAFPNLDPGSMAWYRYDALDVQVGMMLRPTTGTVNTLANYKISNLGSGDTYVPSVDRWIKVRQKLTHNTAQNGLPGPTRESSYVGSGQDATDGNFTDGLMEIWIQEEGWSEPVKMLTFTTIWRCTEHFMTDAFMMYTYFNNDPGLPTQNQSVGFDNFKIYE